MGIVDPVTAEVGKDRTFGLAYFDDLKSLEKWGEEHPTHINIFGGALKYAKTLESYVVFRLFHAVLVLEPEQRLFEYTCSHDGTGMLSALSLRCVDWPTSLQVFFSKLYGIGRYL